MHYEEAEEQLAELDAVGQVIEQSKEHRTCVDGPFLRIAALGVDVHPGTVDNFDEDEQDYIPDFTNYTFTDLGTTEVVYSEGYSSLGAALHNYSRLINLEISIDDLDVEVVAEAPEWETEMVD